jgi:hypothetical protein
MKDKSKKQSYRPDTMPEASRITVWAVALIVASVTFVVYLPALNNEFVNFCKLG